MKVIKNNVVKPEYQTSISKDVFSVLYVLNLSTSNNDIRPLILKVGFFSQ